MIIFKTICPYLLQLMCGFAKGRAVPGSLIKRLVECKAVSLDVNYSRLVTGTAQSEAKGRKMNGSFSEVL